MDTTETAAATDQTAAAPAEARGLPFQVRGSLQTLLCLRLLRPDDPDFFKLLLDKIAHAPDFFRSAPVVLDVAAVAEEAPDGLADLVEKLRQQRLVPVGIQNGTEAWRKAAGELNLAVFGAGAEAKAPSEKRGAQPQPQRLAKAALTITQPVRGGQQVIAEEGDLVVLAPVAHGAEIAAAGHVHVMAPLRGRAFAGIHGDESAMVFCDHLEAELLSVAGVHLVNEEIDPKVIGKRVVVSLNKDELTVRAV